MALKIINGEVDSINNFLDFHNGSFEFKTLQYDSYKSNIYILRSKNLDGFSNTFVGRGDSDYQKELLNLMIPEFLKRIRGDKINKEKIPKEGIDKIQIIGFGPYIPKSIEEIAKEWGFRKTNMFFSDFTGSILKKSFDENSDNHRYFTGSFHTSGLMNYSVISGKAGIKIIDNKSVHNGETYIDSEVLKFEGGIIDSPRHIGRGEDDQVITTLNLESRLLKGQYITFINNSDGNDTSEYFSENSIYLGTSGEDKKHKVLLTNPIFKRNINGEYVLVNGEEIGPIVEFEKYKIHNRGWLMLENPEHPILSSREKKYLIEMYPGL